MDYEQEESLQNVHESSHIMSVTVYPFIAIDAETEIIVATQMELPRNEASPSLFLLGLGGL